VALILKKQTTPAGKIDPESMSRLSMRTSLLKGIVQWWRGPFCISGVVDLKDHELASRVVCVGASEIQLLGAPELTKGGIKPCSDRKPWLLGGTC
jgi:hypothetical protein